MLTLYRIGCHSGMEIYLIMCEHYNFQISVKIFPTLPSHDGSKQLSAAFSQLNPIMK